jgi:hypothetical protein
MSLFEQILAAEEQKERNQPACIGCMHLYYFKSGTPFCKKKDKFILPDYPPTKCELREVTDG